MHHKKWCIADVLTKLGEGGICDNDVSFTDILKTKTKPVWIATQLTRQHTFKDHIDNISLVPGIHHFVCKE